MAGAFLRDDLAGMFDCEGFAYRAVYRTAAGISTSVKVIPDAPLEGLPLGTAGVVGARTVLLLRVCEHGATPARGDTIAYDGTTWRVVSAARDLTGELWTIEVSP